MTAFLMLAAATRLLAPTVADPDLWGHIRFGQRTLAHGIERVDPFSYLTAGHGWINHELLSEVAFGFLYDLGGGTALIALKTLVALLTVGLLYGHLVRRGLDAVRAGLLLLFSLFLLVPGLATVRPQMFTFLFFTLTVLVLYRVEHGRERWLWALPPLFAVWINFHGGVLAGVGIVGVWGLARAAGALATRDTRRAWQRLRTPLAVGAACGGALLLSPYGPELALFLLRTATVPRPDIVEWQPLDVFSAPGAIYLAVVGFAAATLIRSPAPRRPALLAVLVAVVLLPLSAIRHLQLFAIAVPALLADHFAAVWSRDSVPASPRRWERALVTAVTVLAGGVLIGSSVPEARCIRIDPRRALAFPVRAVAWLDASGVEGNMVTSFDWGEYALWHLAPGVKISMDGRRETVYPDSIYDEYLRLQYGLEGWRGVLEREESELVLFSKRWQGYQLVDLDPEWERLYEDRIGGVFARAGHPAIGRLRRTPVPDVSVDGAGECVP